MKDEDFKKIDWATLGIPQFAKARIGLSDEQEKAALKMREEYKEKKKREREFELTQDDVGKGAKAPLQNLAIVSELEFKSAKADFLLPFWFEYFWQEAKMRGDSVSLLAILKKVIKKNPGTNTGSVSYSFTTDAALNQAMEPNNPIFWLGVLTELLKLGFYAVNPKEIQGNQAQPPTNIGTNTFANCMLDEQYIKYVKETDMTKLDIFFRGESRDWNTIILHGGTKRLVDVGTMARDMRMDQDWHPFKYPEINQFLWFRKGQADNDYYTVVSVAMDIRVSSCYPKIDEERVYSFPKKLVADWDASEVKKHRLNLALVELVDGTRKVVVVTKNTVYMFVINNGVVLDTQKAGSDIGGRSYPEKGVLEIPLDNIFGYFSLERFHHGYDPGDGFTAFLRHAGLRTEKGTALKAYYGENGYQKCLIIYKNIRDNQKIFKSAWTASGASNPKIDLNIKKVLENPLSPANMNTFNAGKQWR
jgi:hypothetical protein